MPGFKRKEALCAGNQRTYFIKGFQLKPGIKTRELPFAPFAAGRNQEQN